jgi:hypothetical protein
MLDADEVDIVVRDMRGYWSQYAGGVVCLVDYMKCYWGTVLFELWRDGRGGSGMMQLDFHHCSQG